MEASQPGRILLIDDDPALGGYLTRVLTRGGFEVTHELDSASALLRVGAQDWDPLVTDIELPGMNGLELLERVRQLVPSLPVAVLTGNPTVDYAVSALRPPGRDDPASDSTSGTAWARHAPGVV